jgi:hypothetical protein
LGPILGLAGMVKDTFGSGRITVGIWRGGGGGKGGRKCEGGCDRERGGLGCGWQCEGHLWLEEDHGGHLGRGGGVEG